MATFAGSNKSYNALAIFDPRGVARALDVPDSEGGRLLEGILSGQPASATGYDRGVALLKAVQEVCDGKSIDEVIMAAPRRLTPDELDDRGLPSPPPDAQGDQLPQRAEESGKTAGEVRNLSDDDKARTKSADDAAWPNDAKKPKK